MAGEAAGPSVQFAFPEKNSNLPFPVLTPNWVGDPSHFTHQSPGMFSANLTTDDEMYECPSTSEELDSVPSSPEIRPI
jgi:hypothetical protein